MHHEVRLDIDAAKYIGVSNDSREIDTASGDDDDNHGALPNMRKARVAVSTRTLETAATD
jgi:hypothetical protein